MSCRPTGSATSRAAAASSGCQGRARPDSVRVTSRVADRALDRLQPGQGHEVCAAQLAVDGDGQEHGALVLGQVPDPEAQDVAHLSGHPERLPGRRDAAEHQGPPDLEHEERVAARLLMDQPQHAGAQREAQVMAEQPSSLLAR